MPLTPATDLTLLSENRQRLVYREGGKVFAALASGTSEQTTYAQIGSIKGLFKVELTPITVQTASQQSRAVGADLVATFELVQTFEIEKEALAVFAGKKCKVLVQVEADRPGDNLVETIEEYEFTDQFITPSEIVSALYESVIPMEVRRRVSIQKYIKMTSYSVNVSLDAPTLTWGELRNSVVETTDRSRAIDGSDRGTHYTRAQMVHRDLFRLQVMNSYVNDLSVADQAAIRFEVDFYNWTEWQNRLTTGVPFTSLSLTKAQVFDASYQLTPLQQANFFRSSGWNVASAAADRLQKIVYCRIRAKLGLAVSSWTEFAWVSAPFPVWRAIGASPDWTVFEESFYFAIETFGDYTPSILVTVPNNRIRIAGNGTEIVTVADFQGRNAFDFTGGSILRGLGINVGVLQTNIPSPYNSTNYTTWLLTLLNETRPTVTWPSDAYISNAMRRQGTPRIQALGGAGAILTTGVSGVLNTFDTPNVFSFRNTAHNGVSNNLFTKRTNAELLSGLNWETSVIHNAITGIGTSAYYILGNNSGTPTATVNMRAVLREFMKIVGDGRGNDTAASMSAADELEVTQYLMQTQQSDAWVSTHLGLTEW
jgi:hypothetical protein